MGLYQLSAIVGAAVIGAVVVRVVIPVLWVLRTAIVVVIGTLGAYGALGAFAVAGWFFLMAPRTNDFAYSMSMVRSAATVGAFGLVVAGLCFLLFWLMGATKPTPAHPPGP
jgi:hypothetical protein